MVNISADKIMTLRPYGKPYVVFGVIWGGLSIWISITLMLTANATLWPALATCLIALFLFLAWISLHSVTLDKHTIAYNALVPRSMMAPLSDVLSVETRHISLGNKIRSSGLQSLIIHCLAKKQAKRYDIIINARLFDNDDLEKLVRRLEELGVKVQRH